MGAVHDHVARRVDAAGGAVRGQPVKGLVSDLLVGLALALLVAALLLFVSFDSTFIYQRF